MEAKGCGGFTEVAAINSIGVKMEVLMISGRGEWPLI